MTFATQLRNEKMLACKILDRSNLILDIFASRARTAHAKTQLNLHNISIYSQDLLGCGHIETKRRYWDEVLIDTNRDR